MMFMLLERLIRLWLRLCGFRSRYVDTSVGRMHLLDASGPGDLPPVVILHGFAAAAVDYATVGRRLLPHVRRLVIPDLPGHGFSQTPDAGLTDGALLTGVLESLRTVFDDEPVVLFGNSLGGLTAIHVARSAPDRCRGLMLSSPAGAPLPEPELREFLAKFKIQRLSQAKALLQRIFVHPPFFWLIPAAFMRHRFNRPHILAFLDRTRATDLLTPTDLDGLPQQIRLSWGTKDRVQPRSGLDFFKDNLPERTVVDEPAWGHTPQLENAPELADAIRRFAAQLPNTDARSDTEKDLRQPAQNDSRVQHDSE